jgi:uncharacterized protein YqeY
VADSLKLRITEDMKSAMRAREKERLTTIRLILAAIKQREVDERIELDDTQVLAVIDKMVKQRRDSITQFKDAGREDLVNQEEFELGIIQEYMPAQLSDEEIDALLDEAITSSGAESIKDMGKVMGYIKPRAQGRADMGVLSAKIKARLGQ